MYTHEQYAKFSRRTVCRCVGMLYAVAYDARGSVADKTDDVRVVINYNDSFAAVDVCADDGPAWKIEIKHCTIISLHSNVPSAIDLRIEVYFPFW